MALNVLCLLVGLAMLFAIRGLGDSVELLRLGGLAYLAGIAALTLLAIALLVLGAPVGVGLIVGIAVVLGGVSVGWGIRTGRARPARIRPAMGLRKAAVPGLLCLVGVLAFLAAALRAARLQSLFVTSEWDAWSIWTTKAKAIYLLGGLDPHAFRTFFQPGYPLFVPTLEAMDFHFMGSADTTALHLQFWLLLAGFVWAVGGLLRPRVPHILIWPFVLLLFSTIQLKGLALSPQADFPLAELFGAAGLCIGLWVVRREAWLLAAGGLLLAAAMETKREGYLFAGALLLGALAGSARTTRHSWPRLAAVFALAFAATLPWEIWRRIHDLAGPLQGSSSAGSGARLGPALSSVAQILLDTHFWSVIVPLGLAAALLVLLRGGRRLPVLYLTTLLAAYAGMTWVLSAGVDFSLGPESGQNPIPRAAGAIALFTVALTPLMLGAALDREKT